MQKSTLAALLLLNLIPFVPCFTQSHCIPIDESIRLHEDALRKVKLEQMLVERDSVITLLKQEQIQTYDNFVRLAALSELKHEKQKENTLHMESLALSYKSERDYYQKRERKQRRKKNLLGYGVLVLIGIIIVK